MIPKGHKNNFETLKQAAINGDLALMECHCSATGKPVMVLCAVNHSRDEFEFVPVAKLFDGNPYEEVIPATNNTAA
jgi:hypothetical protein